MNARELKADLARYEANLAKAHEAKANANRLSEQAREYGGGIPGFGGSGSQRAARYVRGAADRAHKAHNEADARIKHWEYKVRSAQRRLAELERVPFTAGELKGARFVHDGIGWREVVRVNAKSVTVTTGYSWTDRVEISKVREWR